MVKLLKMNDDDDHPTENPSSAQIVASIDDLLIEIIQWLPLKSLVQFRLVSSYWNSIILDSKLCFSRNRPAVGLIFEGLKIGNGTPNSYIIFLDKSSIRKPIRKMTPTKNRSYRHCKILHSCNGLLLCVSNRARSISKKYYVCNPTTRKYIALPELVFDHSTKSICSMSLAFDPSKQWRSQRLLRGGRSIDQ
ncbi:hypothetical protein CASFOL_032432 [Castilleja foliolosa]|uniref:F-box domain-containing protein n=1 Tax=Castilleja foliolosa TaxID=1961234 RepID=A0ABD3C1H7_9LAMI